MAVKYEDRVLAVTSSTGAGDLELGSSPTGYNAFSVGYSDGDTTTVLIIDDPNNPSQWELTWVTYNTGSPDTLTRGALISSSTGLRIDFSAGQKNIYVQPTSDFFTRSEAVIDRVNGQPGRNLIINGDMRVAERGSSFSDVNDYTLDRWHGSRSGAATGGVISQVSAGITGTDKALRFQRENGNTSTAAMLLQYAAESQDSIPFAGEFVTLSFQARCGANYSASGSTLKAEIRAGAHTDVAPGSISGHSSVDVTLTTSWQTFSLVTSTALAASVSQLGVWFTATPTGTAGVDDWFEVTEVQLEKGKVTTEFETLPIATVRALCRRYFQFAEAYIRFNPLGSENAETGVFWPEMRIAPTSTLDAAGIRLNIFSTNLFNHTTRGARVNVLSNAGGDTYIIGDRYALDAEL